MARKESFGYLKNKYAIPSVYDDGFLTNDGRVLFDWMDSTIVVHPTGECTETHLGFVGDRHDLVTSRWTGE